MQVADLRGKRALVTGGAGGIGLSCARGLAQAGAEVVIADVSDALCAGAVDELAKSGHAVTGQAFDVADRAAVEQGFEAIGAEIGNVDILVTCAAIVKPARILDFDPEDWARIIEVNLTGTFHCCQLAGRQMVRRGWGRIITLSSVNGQIANIGRGAYACSRACGQSPRRTGAEKICSQRDEFDRSDRLIGRANSRVGGKFYRVPSGFHQILPLPR